MGEEEGNRGREEEKGREENRGKGIKERVAVSMPDGKRKGITETAADQRPGTRRHEHQAEKGSQ